MASLSRSSLRNVAMGRGLSRVPMNPGAYHEEMLTQSKHLNYSLWERADMDIVSARASKQRANETRLAGAIL